jgi:hypothetical protein
MHSYRICIRRQVGPVLVQEALSVSDYAAVRRAERLALPGDTIEVWRAAECIFLREELGLARVGGSGLPPEAAAAHATGAEHKERPGAMPCHRALSRAAGK